MPASREVQIAARIHRPSEWPGERCLPMIQILGWSQFGEATANGLARHRHSGCFELCYIIRGTANWCVGEELFTVRPGELFLTWPDEWHGGENNCLDACELYWAIVDLSLLAPAAGQAGKAVASFFASLDVGGGRIRAAPPTLPGLFENLLQTGQEAAPLGGSRLLAGVTLLFGEAAAAFAVPAAGPRPVHDQRLRDCLSYLAANCHRHPSVTELAARVGLQPSRFRELFRRETGYGPQEYLNMLLVRLAKERLRRPRDSITEIALDLGFASSQYFATAFRKLVGMSPSAYRRVHQQATR